MTGTIKTKTPKFKLIIPLFNIATWHDYIEENFRAIDALFYNIFDIQNFKGAWKNITEYSVGDVVFIPEDYEVDELGQLKTDEYGNLIESQYSGRMVKVLKNHTTDNSDYFSLYYFNHQDEYELFTDASTSQIFAQKAKDAANEAKQYSETATSQVQLCKNEVTNAKTQADLAKQYADKAKISENNASISRSNAKISENIAISMANLAQQYAEDAQTFRVINNTTVPVSAWIDNTSTTYKKKALITLENVTSNQIIDVYFAENEAISGNYSPVTDSVSSGVYIYAKEIPSSDITIPSILIFK